TAGSQFAQCRKCSLHHHLRLVSKDARKLTSTGVWDRCAGSEQFTDQEHVRAHCEYLCNLRCTYPGAFFQMVDGDSLIATANVTCWEDARKPALQPVKANDRACNLCNSPRRCQS